MADLYFKINADYEELIRMQEEASRLKQALSDFSGTRREFESLVDQLNKLEEKMQSCSQVLSEGFTKVNTSGLKEFDQSVLDLCENMEVYFGVTIGEIDEMFSSLRDAISRVGKVELAGADDFDLFPVRQQIIELNEALSSQRDELVKQQEAYRELANTISENFGKSFVLTTKVEQEPTDAVAPVIEPADTSQLQEAKVAYEEVGNAAEGAMVTATSGARQAADATSILNEALENQRRLSDEAILFKETLSVSDAEHGYDELSEQMDVLKDKMQVFAQSVSYGFSQINNEGVDQSIFGGSMDEYISNAITEVDDMLSALSGELEQLGRLELTTDLDLQPVRQQLAGMLTDLMAQREELERQQEAYREFANSVNDSVDNIKTPKVEAVSAQSDTSSIEETKAAYEEVGNAATAAAEVAVEGTGQITEATEELNEALERRAVLSQEAIQTDAAEGITAQVDAERELAESATEAQAAIEAKTEAEFNAHEELRNGIAEVRNELVNSSGVFNQSFGEMIEKAGGVNGVIDSVKKSLNLLPTGQLEKLKSLFSQDKAEAQGAAGVISQMVGENEKLSSSKSALASIQEVVNGLEIAYEVVQRSSLAMLLVEDVKTWALSAAKSALGIATEGATAAQWSFNAAVAANPIGAFIELLVIAAGAIWAFCEALFGSEDEFEEINYEIEETGQLISDLNDAIVKKTIENTRKATEEFEGLRKAFNDLGNNIKEKEKFIDDNAKKFDKLGLNVGSVSDAEKIFVKDTPKVLEALRLQAEYAAVTAIKMELLNKQFEIQAGLFGDKLRLYNKVSVAEARAAGINASGEDDEEMLLTSMDEVNKVNRQRQERALVEVNKALDYLEKQENSIKEAAKVLHQYGNEYIDPNGDGLKTKTNNAERVSNKNNAGRGGRSGRSGKGDQYDEKAMASKREDLLKKYAQRVANVSEKLEEDITKADIDFMAKGTDKQIEAIKNNTQLQLKALEDEKKKLISEYRKMLLDVYMTTKGAKKGDAKYNEILSITDEDIWEVIRNIRVQSEEALTKAQEEERRLLEKAGKVDVIKELEFKFGIGNVDVVSRPIVEAKKMLEAGYAEFKDSQDYATVFSMGNAFTDKEGMEREILYTPILPDGSVLSEKELNEYISKVVASGSSTEEILAADTKKLIIKVDAQVEDGEKLHQLQEQLYDGQQEAISKVYDERLTLNADFNTRQQQIIMAGAKAEFEILNKAQLDAIKAYEGYYDKELAIQRKYNETRAKLEEQHRKGLISDTSYEQLQESINQREQSELDKLDLDRFKTTPMYQIAMSGDVVDSDALQKVYDEMSRQMNEAAATMQPADFKAFMDAFTNISDQMIAKNPFGALKDAVNELKDAENELYWAHQDTLHEYAMFDINEFGKAEEGGKMWQLEQADIDAQRELTNARNAYNEALKGNSADDVTNAQKRLTDAEQTAQTTALQLTAAKNAVTNAEQREGNALTKVQSLKKKEQKATKEAVNLTKQWASAIKQAAEMFDSPVASAISGIMGLTSTTLDGIESIKKASDASAEGISKTAQAVTKAVAILAIIQAAWQVINTIMSLFGGKDEEKYRKRIDGLKAQVDALDYSFNALKEDMDEAWGTEAIDAYIKAVETLNDRQKAQLELIKEQSKAHIGHHSLEHYMKKEAGITDKELAAAKKRIEELGGDTSTGWITDWIYTLTADQLKQFLTEGIGVTITGKLGGVSGTGDYSGSDWLNDLQEFANSAQTAEDIADEMAAKLNGISLDGLKDEIKSLVTTFDTSFNDINNSFDGFMREAAYNKARTKYDKDLEQFYNDLKDINNLYTEGEISEEEYRKRIAEMRERYKSLVKGAQDDYQQSLTDAGVNVKDIEQGATTGGFEALSEDTGTELNGRFAAMQAQETITAENTTKLLEYTLNLHDIADEIRDVQVNSYMELREINENTKKVVEPILDMQENIKKIKEQTESL